MSTPHPQDDTSSARSGRVPPLGDQPLADQQAKQQPDQQPPGSCPVSDQSSAVYPEGKESQSDLVTRDSLANHPAASPVARIGARVLNGMLSVFIMAFPIVATAPAISLFIVPTDGVEAPLLTVQSYAVLYVGLTFLVLIPFHMMNEVALVCLFGGNIGKLILGLRVIDVQYGVYISFRTALMRYLIMYIPLIISSMLTVLLTSPIAFVVGWVGVVWWVILAISSALSGPIFQGLQDRWMGCRVVKKVNLA